MDHSILVHCTRYSGCSIVLAGRDIIYNVKESILKVLALCRKGKNVFRIQKELVPNSKRTKERVPN